MILKKFIVKGLYDTFDYTIPFFRDITFLHGVNGCGKTTILNIISSILSGSLKDYPFKEVRLDYIDNCYNFKSISIKRNKGCTSKVKKEFQNKYLSYPFLTRENLTAVPAESINYFLEVINSFYDTGNYGKRLSYNNGFLITSNDSNSTEIFKENMLSLGEKRLLTLFANLASNDIKRGVYIIDEPELSLHLEWQTKLVDALFKINPKVQLIIATHSPDIISHYSNKAIRLF